MPQFGSPTLPSPYLLLLGPSSASPAHLHFLPPTHLKPFTFRPSEHIVSPRRSPLMSPPPLGAQQPVCPIDPKRESTGHQEGKTGATATCPLSPLFLLRDCASGLLACGGTGGARATGVSRGPDFGALGCCGYLVDAWDRMQLCATQSVRQSKCRNKRLALVSAVGAWSVVQEGCA